MRHKLSWSPMLFCTDARHSGAENRGCKFCSLLHTYSWSHVSICLLLARITRRLMPIGSTPTPTKHRTAGRKNYCFARPSTSPSHRQLRIALLDIGTSVWFAAASARAIAAENIIYPGNRPFGILRRNEYRSGRWLTPKSLEQLNSSMNSDGS